MIQKDHFNKIQKRIKQHKRSLLKKATPPDGGEGARLRYFAPEGKLLQKFTFLTFDTPSGRTKVKKALPRASGHSPLLVCTKIHPVKNFRTAKIFSSLPTFANKNFSVFNEKISAKRSAPSTPESVQSRSVDTDR